MELNDIIKKSAQAGMLGVPGLIGYGVYKTTTKKESGLSNEPTDTELSSTESELQTVINRETIDLLKDLAITQRIYNSEEVEIDEHYENVGSVEGNASLSESGFSLGANGEKRRMTRRVYKFKGLNKDIESFINETYKTLGLVEEKDQTDKGIQISE